MTSEGFSPSRSLKSARTGLCEPLPCFPDGAAELPSQQLSYRFLQNREIPQSETLQMPAAFWRVNRSQGQGTESSGSRLILQTTPSLGPSLQPTLGSLWLLWELRLGRGAQSRPGGAERSPPAPAAALPQRPFRRSPAAGGRRRPGGNETLLRPVPGHGRG